MGQYLGVFLNNSMEDIFWEYFQTGEKHGTIYLGVFRNTRIFGSISKREKGDVAREDKKIGDHGLITTSTLIDSSAIYNPAHLLIGRDTLVGWEGGHWTR